MPNALPPSRGAEKETNTHLLGAHSATTRQQPHKPRAQR